MMGENQDKKILAFVAGATGFTGREVVRILGESHVPTVAHVRPDSPRLSEWKNFFADLGAEVDTTPWEERAMTETLARLRPSLLFALLGTTRARMRAVARAGGNPQSASYEVVDYGYTALLLRAAKAGGIFPRFIYLSATGVTPGARSAYYAARAKAEAEVQASGFDFIIARPSFITGPGRDDPRPGERMGAAIIDGLLAFAGWLGAKKFQARYASTTNTQLAQALVRLALNPESKNRIYESEDLRQSSA